MLEKDMIEKLLNTMTTNIEANKKKILNHFGNINVKDESNQSLLHILVDEKYDEEKCFWAIKTLLEMGLSPNLEDEFKYNFIQTALYKGYSESFILKISKEAFKYGMYVNHQDSDRDTIIHTAIYSDDYLDRIDELLKLYISEGFDIDLICKEARNIVEAMESEYKKYKEEDVERLKAIFNARKQELKQRNIEMYNTPKEKSNIKNKKPINENKKEIIEVKENKPATKPEQRKQIKQDLLKELEKYGEVLNLKKYATCPTIGREDEVVKLMIALAADETSPMIIGESGVGKTAIADELAYRITFGMVPKFLKDRIILEINAETIAEGCVYVGQFEEKINKLMKLVKDNDVILLINEIHTIHGPGSTSKKDNDFASILKKCIDRNGIKVIGTTTKKEYAEYFSQTALKRRFETIMVEEPNDDLLYTILEKVMIDYTVKKSVPIKDENTMYKIIEALIEVTNKKNRKYDDKLCNPALAKSIIDKAFAFALVFEDEYIEEHHFIKAIEWCERIYPASKERIIAKLNDKKEYGEQGAIIIKFKK